MTDDDDTDLRDQEPEPPPGEFDWHSPRWRDADDVQRNVEHDRRLKDEDAPLPSGAIDDDENIGITERSDN